VLDAIAGGLRERPSVKLAELPRMADYAVWGEAVARGLGWGTERFVTTYDDNRKQAAEVMLEDSPVADALLQLARSEPGLSSSPAELHARLTRCAGKQIANSAGWPKTPVMLSQELHRLAPQLRLNGLCIAFERRGEGRFITLTWESVPINQSTCATSDSEKA
jgi:putative DNA primase/helicase